MSVAAACQPTFEQDLERLRPAAVVGVHNFLQSFLPRLFSSFGLPDRLTAADPAVPATR